MKAKLEDGREIVLDEWQVDGDTGNKFMYSRLQNVNFCQNHMFDKGHKCTRCPYVFIGFRSHLHLQKDDGIYERKTGKKIACSSEEQATKGRFAAIRAPNTKTRDKEITRTVQRRLPGRHP